MGSEELSGLVARVYGALRAGDADGLRAVLDPAFVAHFAAGMPAGGGDAHGVDEAIDHWWAIGRAFAVAAGPEEEIACADGRLLVRGTYRGKARADGRPVEAAFAHLWRGGDDDGIAELWQYTDTARWHGTPAAATPPDGVGTVTGDHGR